MSHQNERLNNYEVVDLDASIVSLGDNTATHVAAGDGRPPPTLPNGAVVDGKNTLQSFELPGGLPILPDGQVITGKNTLQSFDTAKGNALQQTPLDVPEHVTDDDAKRLSNGEAPPPSGNAIVASPRPPETVVAVAVENDIVYAEVSPESVAPSVVLDRHENENVPLSTPWYQARSAYVFLTVISLLLAVVLGLAIGLSDGSSNAAAVPSPASNTAVPTSAPIVIDPNITIREAVLTSYINNITFSDQTIMANGTTPESKALAWMIYHDTSVLETLEVISENDPIARNAIGFRIRQRYPLLVMWFQQNETVKWAVTTGWLEDQTECAWEGITCNVRTVYYHDDDYFGGSENVVTQMTFNLVGSYVGVIPSALGLLSNLEHFEIKDTRTIDINDLNERYLQGTLPDSIGQWTDLTHFDVGSNGLSGSLPDSIGLWTALTSFDVGSNGLSGSLPDSIGQWTALTNFDVSRNDLTGPLPDSIGQWTALTNFDVIHNSLNGTIPSSIGNWSLIETVDFSYNFFVGTLPNAICQYIGSGTIFPPAICGVNCTCCNFGCIVSLDLNISVDPGPVIQVNMSFK